MHNTLRSFILIIFLLLFSGCESKQQIEYKIETMHQETDCYRINGEKIILDGDSEGVLLFNSSINDEAELWREDFLLRIEESYDGEKPQLQFRHIVKNNKNNLLSVITEKYTYITGLHGNTWQTARVFDKEKDKTIRLKDLFSDCDYRKILTEKLNAIIVENPDVYHDLWELPIVDDKREDSFYIESGNLVIFYEPYELSYYARGVIEFFIPIEEIRGYVKEEYLHRMGMLRNVASRSV